MKDCTKVVLVVCPIAVVLGVIIGLGVGGYSHIKKELDDVDSELDDVDSMKERINELEKQLANLTNGSKIDREVTSRTMKLLRNETKQLKKDYMELQNETRALNKTINYTTSLTVQRALSEIKNIKETQDVITKKLDKLSHLNDTAEDYLNLREQVNNLTTQVNQSISRLEMQIKDNRRVFKSNVSEINSDVSKLEKRLDEFDNGQNKTNATARPTGTTNFAEKPKLKVVLYIVALAKLEIIQHF